MFAKIKRHESARPAWYPDLVPKDQYVTPARLQPKSNHSSLTGHPSCGWQQRIKNVYHFKNCSENPFTLHQKVLPASQLTLIKRPVCWKCRCSAPVSNIWLDLWFLYWQKRIMLNIGKRKNALLLFKWIIVCSLVSAKVCTTKMKENGNSLRENSVRLWAKHVPEATHISGLIVQKLEAKTNQLKSCLNDRG